MRRETFCPRQVRFPSRKEGESSCLRVIPSICCHCPSREGFFFEQACFLPHSDSALSHRRAAIMVRGGTTYFSVKTFIRLVAARPQDRVPGPMLRRTCPTELSHLMIVRLSLVIFTSCFCAAAIIVICSLKLQKNDMDVNHPDMSETCAHSFFLSQRRGRKTTDDL